MIGPRDAALILRHARRTRLLWIGLWIALGGATFSRPALAADFTLEGGAARPAWSGYWWCQFTGSGFHLYDEAGPYTPLLKYGQVTGSFGALNWERRYKLTANPSFAWFGHCNGWAAATVFELEPTRPVQVGAVVFNVGEIKGLLTACHQGDPVDYFGGRSRLQGADSTTDLRARDLHRAILYYLRDRHEPLIFNLTPKPGFEVWNYPAYAFRMTGVTDPNDPKATLVTTTLTFASLDVEPSFVGTLPLTRTYTYTLQGDPQSINGVAAAEWTGESSQSHPDFVWHPAFQRAHEPQLGEPPSPLDYNWVRRLAQTPATPP